ncbi:MAG: hypothetical protein A3G49_03995 [Candidatus Sungbacteria bacterium RIFCSPLOWO2_12_FULL_41_11]|uniref:Uncharacterized protein n=1 Tax=Candidatus Sungbacteria bacterium RIFCSPLOWO2_12_FULL_41_11 TaxID=1802286 RepID=A0A1G2LT52_9BACT|nr:MAG: hypothetical protein A3D41_02465 [Candidatus Sungbacteria bacterium RIFCSPHIGHO2_02_FULL_41_12b]OHA14825.1 MAG: hypothetical protein A3G49_03995 [Candidatus Sungbacteria bacterium RIFCSPLOWO2_12_FULL_41_11]
MGKKGLLDMRGMEDRFRDLYQSLLKRMRLIRVQNPELRGAIEVVIAHNNVSSLVLSESPYWEIRYLNHQYCISGVSLDGVVKEYARIQDIEYRVLLSCYLLQGPFGKETQHEYFVRVCDVLNILKRIGWNFWMV